MDLESGSFQPAEHRAAKQTELHLWGISTHLVADIVECACDVGVVLGVGGYVRRHQQYTLPVGLSRQHDTHRHRQQQ